MRVALKNVSTAGLRLEVPVGGQTLAFVLGATRGFDGTAELSPGRVDVRGLSLAAQTILGGKYSLPGVGELEITGAIQASNVTAELGLPFADPLGMVGKLGVGEVAIDRVSFVGQGVSAKLELGVDGLVLEQRADRSRSLTVERAELQDVELAHALGTARIRRCVVKGLAAELDATGALTVRVAEVEVDELVVEGGPLRAKITKVELASVEHAGSDTAVQSLRVGGLSFGMAPVPLPELAPAAPGPTAFVPPVLPDLPFFDDLQGYFNVDVTVDISLPIIRSRLATHTMRLDILDGTINFKAIEKGLSGLEDAVIDFEVKKDRLILEKDVPLIPFDNTTLVWWPLEPSEVEVAKKKQRVRLRKLLDYHITDFVLSKLQPSATPSKGAPLVALRRLDFTGLDAELHVGGPSHVELPFATVRLGAEGRPAVGQLHLGGAVCFSPGKEGEPTAVELTLDSVQVGLERLALAGLTASIEDLIVNTIQSLKVTFQGLLPAAVEGSLSGVHLTGVKLGGFTVPKLRF